MSEDNVAPIRRTKTADDLLDEIQKQYEKMRVRDPLSREEVTRMANMKSSQQSGEDRLRPPTHYSAEQRLDFLHLMLSYADPSAGASSGPIRKPEAITAWDLLDVALTKKLTSLERAFLAEMERMITPPSYTYEDYVNGMCPPEKVGDPNWDAYTSPPQGALLKLLAIAFRGRR